MTHSPGGGEGGAIAAAAAEAAASFFAAASVVEAAGGLPAASTFGYLLPQYASGHGVIPAVAALAGAPLYRTTAVPPPPPVPHVAYFAYAPNTAPITVSITYPSSSSSSSSGYFDSPFRPCSRTQWANAPCTSSDDANSSASSLSGFRVGADAPTTPRRDRFRFGHGDWSASLSLDDAEASTMTSSPPCFPAIVDEPECLEVQPVDSMFGAGDWTIKAVVKGAMVMGGVGAGGKGVGALTGGLASQGGDGPCETMGAMRRDSASSGASSVGESSEEEESCSSSSGHSDAVTAVSLMI